MKRPTFTVCILLLATFLIIGLLALILLNPILWIIVYDQTELVPGTTAYSQWTEPQITILLQAYFFNLTNPDEFRAGQKPIVRQVGPYTYREQRKKVDVTRHFVPPTLEYKEIKRYFIDSELSVGPESDIITTVNLGYLAIDMKFGWLPSAVDRVIEFLENRTMEHLIISLSVKDLLWGYEDPFLKLLKSMLIPVPTTMIGLYLNKNNSDDGVIEIYSSNKNPNTFGHIRKYHGSSTLSYWTTVEANQINGTDGSLFHPYMNWNEQPYVFAADICRSIQLAPDAEVKLNDVPLYKYLPFADTFSSPLTTEKNRGFCVNWPNCMKDNVFDVATCYPGSPIVMSLPHLHHADPSYQQGVIGLNPTDELNTTFLIEPQTGVVVSASKKLQINAIVKRNPKFHELSRVTDVYLPVMFTNESFNLDKPTAHRIRSSFVDAPFTAKVTLSVITILLAIACTVTTVCYCYQRRHMTDGDGGQYRTVPDDPTVI